ncbi:putative mitochondrial protein [Tanacetum coccineum]
MVEEFTALHQIHTSLGVLHNPCEVCKLRKALCGLKQASRAWYEKFSTFVTSLGFVSSHHDPTLFVKRSRVGRVLLSLYVDDMIITGDDCDGIELLKAEFLSILLICLIVPKAKYTHTNGDPLPDPSLYRTIVGSLGHFTVTRSDIAYVVHISKKQDILSRSSTEAEHRVMVVTTNEIVWLRWLLAYMGVHITCLTALYCDNRNAIQIARNTVFMRGPSI